MSEDDECAACGHIRLNHSPTCTWDYDGEDAAGGWELCTCDAFVEYAEATAKGLDMTR